MKIVIASDLHGSLYYANMLFERFFAEGAEEIILLGDLYYHGPRNPLEKEYDCMAVANLLNSHKDKLTVIKGNCDAEIDEMISEFPLLGAKTVRFGNLKLTLSHGHIYNKDNLPKEVGDIFLFGHFHTGFIEKHENLIIANPGSTTLPRGGTPRSYLVLTDNELTLKNLETGEIICSQCLANK
ncbi:MAG: phosphodiesterase [Firmicutes bacterium]|nr:phosphodiesterase [Bacillota bacterium]